MLFKELSITAQQRALHEVYDQMWDMGYPVTQEEAIQIADGYLYDAKGECVGRK